MGKRLLYFLLLFIPTFTIAHEASVHGRIVGSSSQVGLQYIKVVLRGTTYETETDSLGRYRFEHIPARNYTVVVDKAGFFKAQREIDLKEGQNLNLDIYLYPEMIDLPAVTTATAKATSASSSNIISAIDMEMRPRNTAQDMLKLVPGLFIAQHAGGGKAEQIFVRGFDCDHGTDIATFVDGVPVNMPTHGHGQGYADLHFLIPEVTQRMEIFKGPYQAQYGDFATGATVAFHTYDTLPHSQVRMEIGSTPTARAFSSSRILAMMNIPTGNSRFHAYAAAEYTYTPGYFDQNAQFHRFNIFGKVKAALSTHTDVTLSVTSFAASWNASGQIPERAVQAGLISRFGSIDPSEGGTTQRTNINLQLHHIHANTQWSANLYYIAYRFKLYSNFSFFLNDSAHGDEIEQTDRRSVVGFNTQYSKYYELGKITTKSIIGAGFRTDMIDNALWHDMQRVRLSNTSMTTIHEHSANIYFKQDFTFTKWMHADVAIRGDYFIFDVDDLHAVDSNHSSIAGYNYQLLPSYKLNLIFSPTHNLQLFVNNGIGYHSNDARTVVQDKTQHILPRAFGAEVGATVHFGSRAIVSTSLWMMDLSDELVYSGDDGTTADNGPSRRLGIDLSGRVQLTQWLTADMDMNYAHCYLLNGFLGGRAKDHYYLPLSPIFTAQGGLTARHSNGLRASLRYRAMADRPANDDNTITAKGYAVVDALIAYERRKYQVSLSVENLLNSRWNEAQFETTSRLRHEDQGVTQLNFTAGTPIAFKVGVSYYFR